MPGPCCLWAPAVLWRGVQCQWGSRERPIEESAGTIGQAQKTHIRPLRNRDYKVLLRNQLCFESRLSRNMDSNQSRGAKHFQARRCCCGLAAQAPVGMVPLKDRLCQPSKSRCKLHALCNIVSLQILYRFRPPKGVRLNKRQINTPPSLAPLAPTVYFLKMFHFFATHLFLLPVYWLGAFVQADPVVLFGLCV